MSRMMDLYASAHHWATRQSLPDDIAHRFAFYRTDGYHRWTEDDWTYEEETPHSAAWRGFCQSEDRSPSSGERYVMDAVTFSERYA